jgi:hypothetical protein
MGKIGLILSEILPFYLRLAVLAAATLAIDLGLHVLNLAWIGRYLGIPGVILVLASFGHSLRKRGLIRFGDPVLLMRLHEWLAWIGSTLILVHAGIHFNAVLAWLAVAAMMVNIASGLTGKYLVQRAHFWLKDAKAQLHAQAVSDSLIEHQLHWDSLGARLVRKWRTIHLPIAAVFAVLATAHIIAIFVFWGWK